MNHGFFGRYDATPHADLHTIKFPPSSTPPSRPDKPSTRLAPLPAEDYATGDPDAVALRRLRDETIVEMLSLVVEHKADVERAATTPPAEWTSDDLRVAVGSIAALAGIVTGGYVRELIEAAKNRLAEHAPPASDAKDTQSYAREAESEDRTSVRPPHGKDVSAHVPCQRLRGAPLLSGPPPDRVRSPRGRTPQPAPHGPDRG